MTHTLGRIIRVKSCGECKYRKGIWPNHEWLTKNACTEMEPNRKIDKDKFIKPGQFPSWCPLKEPTHD